MDPSDMPDLPAGGAGRHRPPEGWRPLSGLAITAFVLSLVLAFVAVLTGYWWLQLIPLGMAVFALVQTTPARHRGRGFAIAGLIVSFVLGGAALYLQQGLHVLLNNASGDVLRYLDEELPEPERDDLLQGWIQAEAVEAGLLPTLKERFAATEARMGPYSGEIVSGGLFVGYLGALMGPGQSTVDEIGPVGEGSAFVPGKTLWVEAAFERGTVHVALMLDPEVDSERLQGQSKAPILSDVRFFAPREP